jgi:uncharacterized membrane protein
MDADKEIYVRHLYTIRSLERKQFFFLGMLVALSFVAILVLSILKAVAVPVAPFIVLPQIASLFLFMYYNIKLDRFCRKIFIDDIRQRTKKTIKL